MTNEILAYIGSGAGIPRFGIAIIPCIFLLVGICFWGLVIFGLVKLIKYLGSAGKEQKLIRMELSKLADELERMRKKSESNEDS